MVSENTGDISDGISEKSDDEQDDQPEPIDEEPEEEEEKPEDMDVRPVPYDSYVQIEGTEALLDEEEEEEVFHRNVEPEVDEEFNREFAKIMSESLESRKVTSKTAFDVEPPTVRTRTQSAGGDIPLDPNRVQFAVLSRRTKQVDLSYLGLMIVENGGYSY